VSMYLVTAYRWGWLNGHQYQVYYGSITPIIPGSFMPIGDTANQLVR